MSKKFVVDTERAPRAIGPFSQAVGFGNLLFVSGMYPQDPHTGEFSKAGIEMQTRRTLDNLMGILLAAGLDASHVVKMTVYLRNMNDYHLMNEAYSSYFDYAPPARSVVEVNRLQRDALISIDAIAAAPVDYDTHAEAAEPAPGAVAAAAPAVAAGEDEGPETPLDHPGPEDYDEPDSDDADAEADADAGWDSIDIDEGAENPSGEETSDSPDLTDEPSDAVADDAKKDEGSDQAT